MLSLVPLLTVPAIIALPSTSIDGLGAKGALGLLSPGGRQWRGGGIAITDSCSIYRRGRHFRRRHVGLANERGRERVSRIVCLTTSHKLVRRQEELVCVQGKLVEYASSRAGLG